VAGNECETLVVDCEERREKRGIQVDAQLSLVEVSPSQ